MKRGYALDITTLSVFHHLLSFLLIYLLSLAKIRIIFGIPNKEYRRNDIKKGKRLHTLQTSVPLFFALNHIMF